jgi:hypothetical protein
MNKITFYILGIFAFLVFTNTETYACSCIQRDEPLIKQVSRAKKDSNAIFSGKVIKVTPNPEKHEVVVKFRAEKSWKGNVSRQMTISTGENSALCGYNFEVGKSYLIYASGADAKTLQTNLCTRTAELRAAKSDLKLLGRAGIPKG